MQYALISATLLTVISCSIGAVLGSFLSSAHVVLRSRTTSDFFQNFRYPLTRSLAYQFSLGFFLTFGTFFFFFTEIGQLRGPR